MKSKLSLFGIYGEIKEAYNLSHLTWFKVGGAAEIFFKPVDLDDLANFLKQNHGKFAINVIGAGSNLLIRDGGVDGLVIKLGRNFTQITVSDDCIIAGGGCLNFNLAKYCLANSLTGLEFLSTIPGTIGGGVAMNAGAYGREFKDILASIQVIDDKGEIIEIDAGEINFQYRKSNLPIKYIVTQATFKIQKGSNEAIKQNMDAIHQKRIATQPINQKTGGSTFVNPPNISAWKLIDKAGLRGYQHGGASLSTLHCNFLINDGNATANDIEELGEYVRASVLKNSGIMLEWEIKRIGKHG